MDEAFIIMQIGNAELDSVCDRAIVPAIEAAGFASRRVDRHNEGDLLKSEIVQFIERSQIIVADLTNERPNCYLEVGFAMGLGKKANLILTAREDHHHSSPNFTRDGPKVHFDLEGYDILFWDPDDVDSFKEELTRRIQRRAAVIRRNSETIVEDRDVAAWRDELRARSETGLAAVDLAGYMEVSAQINPPLNFAQPRLLEAVRDAEVHTFGWPVGVTLENRDEFRPRPTADGIEAEIGMPDRTSYDFWKVFRDGRFYTLMSLFEDSRVESSFFWDTRIHRLTEAFLFIIRLYRRLDASDADRITIHVRHAGLNGRTLGVANRLRVTYEGRTTTENVIESMFTASLVDLESNLVEYVKETVQPLFVVFDMFEVSDAILAEIVEGYVRGEVL